jgi:hypothetical protein
MIQRASVVLAACVVALALSASALAGSDYVGASSGNYARIGSTPYTNGFSWYRVRGGPTYSWYMFTSGGTLQGHDVGATYDHGASSAGWNFRYWKFYNGSPGVQGFNVYWP